MGLAICEDVACSDHRVTSLGTFFAAVVEGFLDGGDILVGHIVADRGVFEHAREVGVAVVDLVVDGLHVADDTGVLARTTALLLVQIVEGGFLGNGFAIVDGRVAYNEVNVVFALHALAINKQVKFSHARNNDFFALFVLLYQESRIFSLKPGKGF